MSCTLVYLILCALVNFKGASSSSPSIFTAIAPRNIFPHSTFNITVFLEEGGSPTQFTASLSSNGKSYFAQEIEINSGMADVINLEVDDLPDREYNLTIKSDTSGAKFEDTVRVFVDPNERVIFVQTDKPIYKPGETVKFRVIVLNRFFKPYEESPVVAIKVLDPARNVIKAWNKEKIVNGLVSLKFELAAEPTLGEWAVQVISEDNEENHGFSVAQYTLPKFKVEVKLPPYITFNAPTIRAEITASYTYGEKLKGNLTVTLLRTGYFYVPYGGLSKVVTKHLRIDGTAEVEFEKYSDTLGLHDINAFHQETEFEVQASVKDDLTGREQNGSATVRMYKYSYKVEQIEQATSYQPGLPFTMKFKVSTQDGVPISDESPDAFIVTHGFAYRAEDAISKSSIPSNGIVSFTFITPSNEYLSVSNLQVAYKELRQSFYLPQRMQSASKIYLQLSMKAVNYSIGDEMEIELKATMKFKSFKYMILGKGQILSSEVVEFDEPKMDHLFKVEAPADAAPQGEILAYSIFGENNEIVAHSINFVLGAVLENKLNLKLSSNSVEPGKDVEISLETTEDSLVAIRGVDQSVLLLGNDKDINMGRIESEFLEANEHRRNNRKLWGGSGTFQVFESAALVVVTNGFLEKARNYPLIDWHGGRRRFFGVGGGGFGGRARPMRKMGFDEAMAESADGVGIARMAAVPMMMASNKHSVQNSVGPPIRVRKNFPETWLWEEFWVSEENSTTTITKTAPDTLTSWIITGYSINSRIGIGVSLEPLTLKTFRPFFISLNLPYSVVRGEVLTLQVLVHNYQSEDIKATVTLRNEDAKFEFAGGKNKNKKSMTSDVEVKASEVGSVAFIIIPTKIGIAMLNVNGTTDKAGDGVSQPLTIKPPGHKQTKNKAVLIDLRSGKKKSVKHTLRAVFPEKRVDDADSVKISLIGDILGASIDNLDKLIQMPCGCGEQNMLSFVPDIIILDYLIATKKLTSGVEAKAKKFLEYGYQREMTYRHYDYSFSAFGQSDLVGSTWLTAFVVRSFVAAKRYITIDENIIFMSLQYLSGQQEEYGRFRELGKVLHSEMAGGSSQEGVAITAYILLAFIESAKNSSKEIIDRYDILIEKGLQYISKATLDVSTDNGKYALVLIAYVLEVAGHKKKDVFFEQVRAAATKNGELMYWEHKVDVNTELLTNINDHVAVVVKPVTVEMTAYALLIFLMRGEMSDSLAIAKFLLKNRNAEGGFLSTQDTVVGLTALAKFAELTTGNGTNIAVQINYDGETKEANVDEENEMVLQEYPLAAGTRNVELVAKGKGTALAQITWSYYIENQSARPSFIVSVKASTTVGRTPKLFLKVCASFKGGEVSNMAVLEVNLPSGYLFDAEGLASVQHWIATWKRHDLEEGDSKLIIYFDYLGKNKTCMELSSQKIFSVGLQKPAYVLAYDYYDTTKKARAFYDVPVAEADSTCKQAEGHFDSC